MSQQPMPVIPREYADPIVGGSPTWRAIVRVTHWIVLAACAVGTIVIALVTTRFGVLIGLVIGPAGILLIVGGGINRDWKTLVLGVGHLGVCVLFASLVNLLHWGPDEAHVP